MTDEEFYQLTGIKATYSGERVAAMEAGEKWRAEMEANIKAMPEPERSKQWERWQYRLAKWQN